MDRGEHQMSDWIECNLPWVDPDRDKKEEELKEKYGFYKLEDEIDELELRKEILFLNKQVGKLYEESLFSSTPEMEKIEAQIDLLAAKFEEEPLVIKWCRMRMKIVEEANKNSFVGQGLNKPGVLIETDKGQQLLIGNLNPFGGCGYDYDPQEMPFVVRYKVLSY